MTLPAASSYFSRPRFSAPLMRAFLAAARGSTALSRSQLRVLEQLEETGTNFSLRANVASRLLDTLADVTNDSALGLRAAGTLMEGALGVFDYVVSFSPTPRDAFRNAQRFVGLVSESFDLTLNMARGRALISLDESTHTPAIVEDFGVCVLARVVAARWQAARRPKMSVHFREPAPVDLSVHRTVLGSSTDLRFEQDFAGLSFPVEWLDEELPGSDATLSTILCESATRELEALRGRENLVFHLKRFLRDNLGRSSVGIEAAAYVSGLSTRSLCRRLAEEGTTYRGLVDQTRRSMALELLEKADMSWRDISARLGFSEASSFYRSFHRWTGMTPGEFRGRLAASRNMPQAL